MRASVPLVLAVLLAGFVLTACGLKDDLYLPPETSDERHQDNERDDAQDT